MPASHAMLPEFNRVFSPEYIRELDPELLAPGSNLVESAKLLQEEGLIKINPTGIEFLEQVPPSLQEGVRAVLFNAVTRGLPVQFAWAPAYDFELNVWEATGSDKTTGGITILLRSPYGQNQGSAAAD